jgi:tetratricopeptide (TPR) repeat protein
MLGAANIGLERFEEAGRLMPARPNSIPAMPSFTAITPSRWGLDRLDDAVAAFARARPSPGLCQAHFNLGNALRKQQKIEPAIASYERAVAVRPDFAGAWNNLGSAYQQQNRATDALDAYRRAVAINPISPEPGTIWDMPINSSISPRMRWTLMAGRWRSSRAFPTRCTISAI